MFKKRNVRPPPSRRKVSEEDESVVVTGIDAAADEETIDLEDLYALRKLKRARQGIDSDKLSKGQIKKKKVKVQEEEDLETVGDGMQKPKAETKVESEEDSDGEDAKTRRLVRSNNFTQQTNALDVDKHMMAYIEEGLKTRRGDDGLTDEKKPDAPHDPYEELYQIEDKYKLTKKKEDEEGNVTNSMAMLTAIPEVDLGMDVRLRNIEETEKAKRAAADQRQARPPKGKDDEAHLAAARFYRPHQAPQADGDALRNAQLEAMGLPQEREARKSRDNRKDMATDDVVMERFKKRMRR